MNSLPHFSILTKCFKAWKLICFLRSDAHWLQRWTFKLLSKILKSENVVLMVWCSNMDGIKYHIMQRCEAFLLMWIQKGHFSRVWYSAWCWQWDYVDDRLSSILFESKEPKPIGTVWTIMTTSWTSAFQLIKPIGRYKGIAHQENI